MKQRAAALISGAFALTMAFLITESFAQSTSAGASSSAGAGADADAIGAVNNPITSLTFEGSDPPDIPVSTPDAIAPGLTTSNGTCAGSTSGGFSLGTGPWAFGVSGGTTWMFQNCDHRYNSDILYQQGYRDAAKEVMCAIETVRAAFARTGEPCAETQKEMAAAAGARHQTVSAEGVKISAEEAEQLRLEEVCGWRSGREILSEVCANDS